MEFIEQNLMKAKEQTSDSQKNVGLQNVTQFGVAKAINTESMHEGQIGGGRRVTGDGDQGHDNNTLFNCDSLAPKLKRGGGCMDHGFTRHKELWEMSDGAVFIIREVSKFEGMHDTVTKNLENLINLCYIDHFKQTHSLKENLFKSLTQILKALGKKKFRGYIELFLDPVFRNAKDQKDLNMATAAQDFILEIEKTYGPGIFKAILESNDERFIDDLERYREVSKRMGGQDFIYPQGHFPPGALYPSSG